MAGYNQYSVNTSANMQNTSFFNRTLRKLSSYGLTYDIQAIKNTVSIGAHEDPRDATSQGSVNDGPYMYDIFTKKIIAKLLDKKSIAYLDRTYYDKRKILSQYSTKDEIRDYLNQIADEAIIFDQKGQFCKPLSIPDEFDQSVKQKVNENFINIYNNFKFNDGISAWNYFKKFLIEGYLAFEIVYDDKQKTIIELSPIDPMTLVVVTDPTIGTILWIQYPDNPQLRRILLDAQVIYISYSNNNEYGETSYVEGLIRPFNQLKLLEQTKILYNINQAALYKKFVIPTGGLTKVQAEQQIYQLMSEYHEDVQWDDKMGTVSINGSSNIPHSKDYWFPSSAEGTPDISIMKPESNDLNEDQMLKWFLRKLQEATRIPFSRFDKETGGGNLYNDTSEVTRDEIKFKNYINRLRTVFKEILIKPLRIQMYLDFPELREDNLFRNELNLNFNSNELFEEWKMLNNLEKRSQIAATLNSNIQSSDGTPYLAVEWIVRNIMRFTDEDIEINKKYKLKEAQINGNPEEKSDFGPGSTDFFSSNSGGGESSSSGGEAPAQAQPSAQAQAQPAAQSGGGGTEPEAPQF